MSAAICGFKPDPERRFAPSIARPKARSIEADSTDLRVQPHFEKYFGFLATQITTVVRTVSSHQGGVSRSSRTRDGMRWTPMALLTNGADADGEVVWS